MGRYRSVCTVVSVAKASAVTLSSLSCSGSDSFFMIDRSEGSLKEQRVDIGNRDFGTAWKQEMLS